jgi:hypothetical protein
MLAPKIYLPITFIIILHLLFFLKNKSFDNQLYKFVFSFEKPHYLSNKITLLRTNLSIEYKYSTFDTLFHKPISTIDGGDVLKKEEMYVPKILDHQTISFETTISGGGGGGDDGKVCCCWPPFYTCKLHRKHKPWKPPGHCFITDSCVKANHLPDDCEELTIIRNFRDSILVQTVEGRKLVGRYYEYAPIISERIKSEENSLEIYQNLYQNLVLKCVDFINKGKPKEAELTYRKVVEELELKYL